MAQTAFAKEINGLLKEGDFDRALARSQAHAKSNPKDPAGHTFQGISYQALGHHDKARAAFEAAYKEGGGLGSLRNLVDFELVQGNAEKALAVLEEAPDALTEKAAFGKLYLKCAVEAGEVTQAITRGKSFAAIHPDDVELVSEVARLMVTREEFEDAAALLADLATRDVATGAVLANLGMLHSRLGRDEAAIEAISKAISAEPENPQHYNTLAAHQRRKGLLEEAEASLIKALTLDPKMSDTLAALGSLVLAQGRFLEAADCFRAVTRLTPERAKAHQQLAQALQRMRRYDSAIESLEAGLEREPGHAPSLNSMGVILKKLGRIDEAVASYRAAVAADPDMREAQNNLVNALRDINALEEAQQVLEAAIERWPDYAELYNSRGVFQQQSGNKEEAVASYRRAIELNPDLSKAYHNLTAAQKLAGDDPVLQILKSKVSEASAAPVDLTNYNFALGKALRDTGAYEASFEALERGNRLRKTDLGYSIERDKMLFANVKSFFSGPGLEAEPAKATANGKTPIFILGMPRSGTSLAEQILSSHPSVHGCGELEFMSHAVKTMPWQEPGEEELRFEDVRQSYLNAIAALNVDAPIFTDKMPLNSRWVGWILKALPEAKVIHMVRDPMAVCWSNYQRFFPAEGMAFTFDQRDVAEYHNLYRDLMTFWHETFPGQIYDLVYEDLTEDQEAQTRALCEYLDLPWDDQMLNFQENERNVKTASSAQVREKMYRGSSEEWRKFENFLGPMKETLGYEG